MIAPKHLEIILVLFDIDVSWLLLCYNHKQNTNKQSDCKIDKSQVSFLRKMLEEYKG